MLHPADDVAVVGQDTPAGTRLSAGNVTVSTTIAIPSGHKVALRAIAPGETVRKYGQVIGLATAAIASGDHVHIHNLGFRPIDAVHELPKPRPAAPRPVAERTFQGFRRRNGKVGTRNMIGLLTTVNCSASVSRFIAAEVEKRGLLRDFPTIDGIVALTHATGCGMLTEGEGFELLRRTLVGYASHPNFGGVLLLSLGCEFNELQGLLEDPRMDIAVPHRALVIQEEGGTRQTVQAGIDAITELLPRIAEAGREPVPASELVVAMECGGSDAYSGLSANPVVGRASDRVVWEGGTAAFGETPRDLRGRAPARSTRARPTGRSATARPGHMVAALPGEGQRLAGRQPVARQQGGRHHHHPREVAGSHRQGRQHRPGGGRRVRRGDARPGPRLHGHAGL